MVTRIREYYSRMFVASVHPSLVGGTGLCSSLINGTVDPWFNFRASKYLVQHGFYKFWDWFDDSTFILPQFFASVTELAFLKYHITAVVTKFSTTQNQLTE